MDACGAKPPTPEERPPKEESCAMSPPLDLGKNTSRRPHRKSRLGCNNCKKRRVKCDEALPACTYCCARSLPCQYPAKPKSPHPDGTNQASSDGNSAAGSTVGTPGRSLVPEAFGSHPPSVPSPAFGAGGAPTMAPYGYGMLTPSGSPNVDDLELLFNFTNSTVNSISPYHFIVDFWREQMPQLAFNWPFLLHGLFALSSMQLARFRRDGSRRSSDFYASQATFHWHQGLRLAGALLPQINDENCHALYVFAIISCLFSLARGPRPGDFLMFGSSSDITSGAAADGTPDWCLLLRGIGPIGETFWLPISRGPVAALTINVFENLRRFQAVSMANEAEPFRRLRAFLRDAEGEGPDWPVYTYALDVISRGYSVVYDEQGVPGRNASDLVMYAMFSLTESTPFIALLQARVPPALIVFAHFVALFKEVDMGWITSGWAPHLMAGVYETLIPRDRVHITWPMKRLGWIPPE